MEKKWKGRAGRGKYTKCLNFDSCRAGGLKKTKRWIIEQSQEALEYAKKITVELGAVKQVTNHVKEENRAGLAQSVQCIGYTQDYLGFHSW